MYDVLVIGGGAAGFYAAIHIVEARPQTKIAILERGKEVLTKVKISGGGRCNVTHAEFIPRELAANYPRGEKELLGPFHQYASGDTMDFFEKRGVPLKIEEDGRMFPVSNTSQTIIDCFLSEASSLGIAIKTRCPVRTIGKHQDHWQVHLDKEQLNAKMVVFATGSNPKIWKLMAGLGHRIIPPVPSLFTFNSKDPRIRNIPGVSTFAQLQVLPNKSTATLPQPLKKSALHLYSEGPLLVTHWGLSGPAILKLSAWGARVLEAYKYQFNIQVNWVPTHSKDELFALLLKVKQVEKKSISKSKVLELPKRLWVNLVKAAGIEESTTWAEVSKQQLQDLVNQLTSSVFNVNGKSTFKEEFVTAGGIDLKDINFKTFESKIVSGLYFAGEITNVDAITGGFNFQNAWTGGFLAAQGVVQALADENL